MLVKEVHLMGHMIKRYLHRFAFHCLHVWLEIMLSLKVVRLLKIEVKYCLKSNQVINGTLSSRGSQPPSSVNSGRGCSDARKVCTVCTLCGA